MSGPPAGGALLDLLEPGWRRHLASGAPGGTLEVEPEVLDAAARALGELARSEPPMALSRRWPACIVVAVAQVTARHDQNGKVWPAWHRATGSRASKRSGTEWAAAFLGSLAVLGVPPTGGDPGETVLAHAAAAGTGPAGAAGTGRHPVRSRLKPQLMTGAAIPGARTTDGLAVFGMLPAVRLPAGEARWRVEVRRSGRGPVLAAAEASGDDWDPERLWDRVPRPVLGELVVTVTAPGSSPGMGARGTGLRRVVAVAEGLDISYSPALRLMCEQGLDAAEAVLSAAPGMTASPSAAVIPAGVTDIAVACVAGPVVLPLRLTPPHCRMRMDPEPGSGDPPTAWHSLGPLPLEAADLIRGGALRLDLPGTGCDPPVDVVAASGVVQVLEPARHGGYPLRRMLDTVSAHGGAELRVTVGGRTAVIARVGCPGPAADPWLPG